MPLSGLYADLDKEAPAACALLCRGSKVLIAVEDLLELVDMRRSLL